MKANKTTNSNHVVNNITININWTGNVIIGDNNVIVDESSDVDRSIGTKSTLAELFSRFGKFIAKIVSSIKAVFMPKK